MSFVPTMAQLDGLSYEVASLYGMPHLFCKYERDDVNSHKWAYRQKTCAACGRIVSHRWSVHHEPPKSKGRSFLLSTPMGQFVLRPALIGLCGSGTEGCHGDRHNGKLKIRWEWESDEIAEKWWNGYWLSHGYIPHSPKLFNLGHYVFEKGIRTKKVYSLEDAERAWLA